MVVEVHQDLADILEVLVLVDMEDPVGMEDLAEEMQEMTEVVEEKVRRPWWKKIAMVDVVDGNRYKT